MKLDLLVFILLTLFYLTLTAVFMVNAIYLRRLSSYAYDNPDLGDYNKIKKIKTTDWIIVLIALILALLSGWLAFKNLKSIGRKKSPKINYIIYAISLVFLVILIPLIIVNAILIGRLQGLSVKEPKYGDPNTIKGFEITNWVLLILAVALVILTIFGFVKSVDKKAKPVNINENEEEEDEEEEEEEEEENEEEEEEYLNPKVYRKFSKISKMV